MKHIKTVTIAKAAEMELLTRVKPWPFSLLKPA
jgi:hypothetical protein